MSEEQNTLFIEDEKWSFELMGFLENDIHEYLYQLPRVLGEFVSKEISTLKDVSNWSVEVSLVQEREIQRLNRDYRNKDYVTDVLSFPLQDNLRLQKSVEFDFIPLGNIVICKQKALSQAREHDISYQAEVVHLIIHGLLHLFGYDHEISDEERRLMERYESELLDRLAISPCSCDNEPS